MRIVQLIVAGLMAVFAVLAVIFAAVVVFFGAILASIVQIFTGKPKAARPPTPSTRATHARVIRADDAIDVETEVVSDDPPSRN